MKKICLVVIATKKYKQFIQPLIEGVKKHFLPSYPIDVVLFTDDISTPIQGDERVRIYKDLIVSYGFPEATLLRYKIITSRTYDCSYLFYIDVDMAIAADVKDEILANITAVLHPGFYRSGGSWSEDKNSNAYTFPENRIRYFAGGFQGGEYEHFYSVCKRLARDIEDDEKRGVRAVWNDESHWNKFLSEYNHINIMNPSYCMVEQEHLRKEWKIDHFPAKIIALAKNHEEIRS